MKRNEQEVEYTESESSYHMMLDAIAETAAIKLDENISMIASKAATVVFLKEAHETDSPYTQMSAKAVAVDSMIYAGDRAKDLRARAGLFSFAKKNAAKVLHAQAVGIARALNETEHLNDPFNLTS